MIGTQWQDPGHMNGDGYQYTRCQQVENKAALKSYCEKKIKHINKQNKISKELHQKKNCTAIKSVEPVSERCVPAQFICTLWMKTFEEEIRKGAKQDFHDPSCCGACLNKQADLAMNNFIRTKRNQLQAQLLEDRIQTHLYSRDTVCLLGELLRDMPKYSDDPSQIWERLLSAEHRQTL